MNIEIEYDGAYPNLCRGKLTVILNGMRHEFPDYCLASGGYVSFDKEWQEEVGSGSWNIDNWPESIECNATDELKKKIIDAINDQLPWGCCGGCV